MTLAQRIAYMFANSEPGAWYDPSDMSTLFQDSAGTVPVTAVEQPVGLMLDKSKGLALGPELVTNGDFSNGTTGWSAYNAVISAVNGTLKVDDSSNSGYNSSAVQQLNLVAGRTYLFTFDVVSVSGAWSIGFATTDSSAGITFPSAMLSKNTTGPQRFVFTYDGTRNFLFMAVDGSGIVFYDNISVKELPGNHASQATTTKRPIYSRRVNLLTKTEQFDDAAWGKVLCSVTPNSSTAPDGTLTADLIIPGASSGTRYVSTAGSGNSIYKVRIKNGGLRYATFGNAAAVTVVDLDSGTISTTSGGGMSFAITGLGDGWYEVTCTNPTATAYQYQLFAGVDGTGGNIATDGVAGIYAWGASLTLATDAHLPYQYVNTDTDYDADPAKFPAYLRFDGVDDALQTGNIDFTGTDKMTVWAGALKSDAAAGMQYVAYSNGDDFNGFSVYENSNRWYGYSSGATSYSTAVDPLSIANTQNSVLAVSADQIAPYVLLRRDYKQVGASTAAQGGGGYGNRPLYIGARAGTSQYFNGRLGCLIIRGAQSNLSQIEAAERYIKQKMRLP